MTFEKFSKIIERLKSNSDKVNKAYELKIDLIDFNDDIHRIIDDLVREIYGEPGYDWFSWFCCENDFGRKDWSSLPILGSSREIDGKTASVGKIRGGEIGIGAWDENGDPICYDVRSTWIFLEKNYSRIQKNEETDPSLWETIKESGDKINSKRNKRN
jgi:hypothetical protein